MQMSWDQAAPGITQAFQMLMSNPYAGGQQRQIAGETALGKALWGIEHTKAQIDNERQKADNERLKNQILASRPDIVNELMTLDAQQAGFTGGQDAFNEARQRKRQGLPAAVFDSGEQTMIDPKADTAVTRALISRLPMLGAEQWNPDNIQNAYSGYQDDFRAADAVGNPQRTQDLQALQFARKGNARYDVKGNEMIDQLGALPFRGQTALGQSMIRENDAKASNAYAHAARTKQGAQADKFVIKEGQDADGNPTYVRVPVQGAAGEIDTGGVRPNRKRNPEDVQGNAEYRAAYPWPTPNDPSQSEFNAMRKAGKDPVVEFQKIIKGARQAIKDGKDPAAVRERLQSLGVNPARLDQ